MSKIALFQTLEDRFGREHATALAEFIEHQQDPAQSRYATKDDLKDLELRLIKDIAKTREELGKDIAKTREELGKDIAKTREDMITRLNWSTIIQVLTTVGALAAIAKVI